MQQANIAKLRLVKRAQNSLPYMESKRLLPFAQTLTTGHYSDLGDSSP
jgi:hypothetical protein